MFIFPPCPDDSVGVCINGIPAKPLRNSGSHHFSTNLWVTNGQIMQLLKTYKTDPQLQPPTSAPAPMELGEAVATLVCKVQLMKTSQTSCKLQALVLVLIQQGPNKVPTHQGFRNFGTKGFSSPFWGSPCLKSHKSNKAKQARFCV